MHCTGSKWCIITCGTQEFKAEIDIFSNEASMSIIFSSEINCNCTTTQTSSGTSYSTHSHHCTSMLRCCLRQHGSVVCVLAGEDGSLFTELNKGWGEKTSRLARIRSPSATAYLPYFPSAWGDTTLSCHWFSMSVLMQMCACECVCVHVCPLPPPSHYSSLFFYYSLLIHYSACTTG